MSLLLFFGTETLPDTDFLLTVTALRLMTPLRPALREVVAKLNCPQQRRRAQNPQVRAFCSSPLRTRAHHVTDLDVAAPASDPLGSSEAGDGVPSLEIRVLEKLTPTRVRSRV